MDVVSFLASAAEMSNSAFAFRFGLACVALAIVGQLHGINLSPRRAGLLAFFGLCLVVWGVATSP